MSRRFDEMERQACALSPEKKATLARVVIEGFDIGTDAELEEIWIDEAQCRYDAYLRGELAALPGETVMQSARSHLKSTTEAP